MTDSPASSFVPTKDDVAAFYDTSIPLINELVGDNVHVGYWSSSGDKSSLQEATDRMTDMV
ncbi:class I SAM-dependent methyltransferase, partial [Streptomyces mirabilis]